MDKTVSLIADGEEFSLPAVAGTEGERAIDIRRLRDISGHITYDPGYGSTGSTRSAITFLDGEKGILRYRGYAIEELAEQSTFLETSYLLIYGELPTKKELSEFSDSIVYHTLLHEDMRRFFDAFPKDAHPMAILSSATSALSTFYQDSHDPFNPSHVEISTHRLMAKLPTVAAFAYKKSIGQAYIYPRNDLDHTSNFLHMMFAVKAESYEVSPEMAKALNLLLILHADHEQNASTSTVRLVGSTHANLFASVAAGITALWGPLHGGANQAVVEMLAGIRDAEGATATFIERAKDKDDPFRLSGFGHRVYKQYDPRARILKQTADQLIADRLGKDPLLEVAKELEEVALTDDYFLERKLYPNVDFYSGLIYRAMGFPLDMYPVLFALGRLPGWIAQWREMMADADTRIGRPRQIFVGAEERPYRPRHDR